MKNTIKITSACLGLVLSVSAFAAGDNLKHSDHAFVEKAAKSGMEEVAISQVAVERAQNPLVKEFAQMMVMDHTGANTELTALATTKAVKLPDDKTNVEKWSKCSVKEFDGDYLDKMLSDHKDAVELFEKESKNGADMELKAFATKTLPTLQAHLEKVKQLKMTMK